MRFTRVVDMINTLTTAQLRGTLEKRFGITRGLNSCSSTQLGYLPIDKRGADLLFQVVAARYECGSVVVSTNRAFREWGTMFDGDNTLATAMIDRLMHHGGAYRHPWRKLSHERQETRLILQAARTGCTKVMDPMGAGGKRTA